MRKVEYKTIQLPYKTSLFATDNFEVGEGLNVEAKEGWRVVQIVLPSTVWGRANSMIAILERDVE
jgi:hypothetical protein